MMLLWLQASNISVWAPIADLAPATKLSSYGHVIDLIQPTWRDMPYYETKLLQSSNVLRTILFELC